MTHRRCGTCKFFEEGSLAGSGWCRHPQRQHIRHIVLVRRGELACRTGWDEDLWEPRQEPERPPLAVISGSWEANQSLFTGTQAPTFPTRPEIERINSLQQDSHISASQGENVPLITFSPNQSGETEPFPLLTEPVGGIEVETAAEPLLSAETPHEPHETLSSLPRICRTCRNFRPVDDGRFGWCGNPYAVPERQLVSADSLSCLRSFGSWWLPSDEWWLRQADISHHGQPAPLFEEFLRQLQEERRIERRRRASS